MSEFEQQLVGSLLLDPTKISEVECQPQHFENGFYREIFQMILQLSANNEPSDAIIVAEKLEARTGKDWLASVASVAANAIATPNIGPYSLEIKKKANQRQAIQIAKTMMEGVNAQDDSAIDQAIVSLMTLNNEAKPTAFTLKETLRGCVNHLEQVMEGKRGIALTTGYKALDANLGGFHDSDLIIIGARPAMGKTALALNFMLRSNVACGFFSTEQSALQVGNRLACIQGGIIGSKIRSGNLDESDWAGFSATIKVLSDRNIFIDEESQPTILDVQRQARKWKQQYGIKVIHLDYIQRIHGTDRRMPKHERVEEVTQGLKSIAKELNVPVVALSQVNRSVDTRHDKRPNMGDLSDSSAVEKEADVVMMLYRDEVYNTDTNRQGVAELILEKNRHGPTNYVSLAWDGPRFRFEDLNYDYGK